MRTTLTNDRLNSLTLMSCEKDLTDAIDFTSIAGCWATLESRQIQPPKMQSISSFQAFLLFVATEHLLHFSICISFSYDQVEHEPIECVHTSIMRTSPLCYRNRQYKKITITFGWRR